LRRDRGPEERCLFVPLARGYLLQDFGELRQRLERLNDFAGIVLPGGVTLQRQLRFFR
jgi:hypothetical protein